MESRANLLLSLHPTLRGLGISEKIRYIFQDACQTVIICGAIDIMTFAATWKSGIWNRKLKQL